MASNDWERYKWTVLNLYCIESMPLNDVVLYMKQTHNFDRTQDAYTKQFKKWGIRKNMRRKDWQYLAHQIRKRKGKKTEVTLYGALLSHEKLHKEIQRYTNIPTASEFGKRLPSPEIPEGMIVRVWTPPIPEPSVSWPNSLPWFRFKNRVLPKLRSPSEFLRAFFLTSAQYIEIDVNSPYVALRNTVDLRPAVIRLSNEVPGDSIDMEKKADALARNEFPPCLVTEMIKVIFFRLSNKLDESHWDRKEQAVHDQFILHLVNAVSRSNPGISSAVFSGKCATTKAIKESIYSCAIRQKDYALVQKLLRSGVSPDLPVDIFYGNETALRRVFQRGMINLIWEKGFFSVTGLEEAAITRDIRLAEILLQAGAGVNNDDCLLELAAYASELASPSDGSIDLVELLVNHGATVGPFEQPCHLGCLGGTASLFFALATAGKKARLSEFLTEKGAITDLSWCSRPHLESCWNDDLLESLHIPYTPEYLAIILGNKEIIERVILSLFSRSKNNSLQTIKRLLLVSCLAGDTVTALRLLRLEDTYIDLNEEWPKDVTPLIASAWNPDTRIAEALLDLGASIGPTLESKINQTSILCPIQVAIFHGNTSLVQQLINRGANCNVRFKPDRYSLNLYQLSSLAPILSSRPLQFSHKSKNADTIRLLLFHLNLLAGDSSDQILISDLITQGTGKSADEDGFGNVAFGAAIRIGSEKLLRYYLSLGDPYSSKAFYLATEVAIQSKDYSILKLLAEHRHMAQIDSFEASSLVLAITEGQWDLVSLLLCDPFLPGAAKSFYCTSDLRFLGSYSHENSGDGVTPLSAALCSGEIVILRNIIRRGYKAQASDATALIRGGIGKYKISDTIQTAFLSEFPLHEMDFASRATMVYNAIKSKDIKQIRESIVLIESLDIPVKEFDLRTYTSTYSPLELAADSGQMEVVSLLVNSGANPDYSRPNQLTALELAAYLDNLEIVEYLLDQIKVINPSFRQLKTSGALNLAAHNGNLKMARLLIEAGADVNRVTPYETLRNTSDNSAFTALEAAALRGRLDMTQLLLENDAKLDKNMRIHYVRAIGFAMGNGHFAVADYLKQCGSWGQKDHLLHDCLVDLGLFDLYVWYNVVSNIRHDESTDIWYIKNRWNDEASIPQLMQGFGQVDSDRYREWFTRDPPKDKYSNSCDDRDDTSNNKVEDPKLTMQRNTEIVHKFQTWRNDLGCITPTALNKSGFISEIATNYSSVSSCEIGGNRVIAEIEDIPETDTVVEQTALQCPSEMNSEVAAFGYLVNEDITGSHDLDKAALYEPGGAIPETLSLFDAVTHTSEIVFLDEPTTLLKDPTPGIEWPLAGVGGLDVASDPFGNLNLRADEVSQFNTLGMIVANGQNVLPCAEDIGWEGPFTHLGEIDGISDTMWNFPIEEVPFDLS